MTSLFRKTIGAALLLTGLAAPALAQPYDGGGYYAPYHQEDGGWRHERREAMWRTHERREAYDQGYGDDRPPCHWDD